MICDVTRTAVFADSIFSFEEVLGVIDFYCRTVIKWLHSQAKEDRFSFWFYLIFVKFGCRGLIFFQEYYFCKIRFKIISQ
jgi:hypothetical protein